MISDDHHEVEKEGIIATHSNSFAILSNQRISDLASKMGIHTHSISFEKINMLKDLENARIDMVNKSKGAVDQNKCLEEENLPLEDQNILDWQSDSSDEEQLIVIDSIRKNKSGRKGKKKNSSNNKKHPLDVSGKLKGDKSKVSPRFNLRDRNTIKKVIK